MDNNNQTDNNEELNTDSNDTTQDLTSSQPLPLESNQNQGTNVTSTYYDNPLDTHDSDIEDSVVASSGSDRDLTNTSEEQLKEQNNGQEISEPNVSKVNENQQDNKQDNKQAVVDNSIASMYNLNPVSGQSSPDAKSNNPKYAVLKTLALALGIVMIVIAIFAAGYLIALSSFKTAKVTLTPSTSMKLGMTAIPQGATIISQCEPGLGTQYVLPKNIPMGPVYNVYKGQLIGIEFMVSKTDLATLNKSYANLPLFGYKYDHIDISSMAAHAGFPVPHYQVDVMMAPSSITSKITCGSNSSAITSMKM